MDYIKPAALYDYWVSARTSVTAKCKHFAKPLLKTDKSYQKSFTRIGTRMVKKTELELYNYYKRQDFGAPLTADQKES
jgi:hypothetical protein